MRTVYVTVKGKKYGPYTYAGGKGGSGSKKRAIRQATKEVKRKLSGEKSLKSTSRSIGAGFFQGAAGAIVGLGADVAVRKLTGSSTAGLITAFGSSAIVTRKLSIQRIKNIAKKTGLSEGEVQQKLHSGKMAGANIGGSVLGGATVITGSVLHQATKLGLFNRPIKSAGEKLHKVAGKVRDIKRTGYIRGKRIELKKKTGVTKFRQAPYSKSDVFLKRELLTYSPRL